MHAHIVEDIDANPLTVLHSEVIDDGVDLREAIEMIVNGCNKNSAVFKARGAFVWSPEDSERRFEFRVCSDGILRESPPVIKVTLSDTYMCHSGRTYGYYCRSSSFPNSRVEVYLYPEGKNFSCEDVLNGPDILLKRIIPSERLVNIEMSAALVKALAKHVAEQEIETWDAALESGDGESL